MLNKAIYLCSMLFLTSLSLANSKASGTGCDDIVMGPEGYKKAAQLADKLNAELEQRFIEHKSKAVLLARIGSNAAKDRFIVKVSDYWKYTHAAFATRDEKGDWHVTHLLNQCGAKSDVYTQALMPFFLDDPFQYKVIIIEPELDLQSELYNLIQTRQMAKAFFNSSNYSSVSNPFNTQFQNSNEYILDVMVAAMAPKDTVFTREQSKEYFLNHLIKNLRPERVKVGGIENIGISLGFGPDNATLEDHDKRDIARGELKMVSVGSLIEFLARSKQLYDITELRLIDYHRAKDTKNKNDAQRN